MAPVSRRKPPSRKGSMAQIPDEIIAQISGLERLFTITPEQLCRIVDAFVLELEKGLEGKGDIPMIPTWVFGYATGKEEGSYLAIDMGGTNVRVCEVNLLGDRKYDMIQAKYRIEEELKHGEREALFSHVADCVKMFIEDHHEGKDKSLPLGFTFSYPCSQNAIDHGVLQRWTKGFDVKDTEGVDVVPVFNKELERAGLDVRCTALINDTTGTLIASNYVDPDMKIAVIFGTGCNAAYMETVEFIPKLHDRGFDKDLPMAINCEWGAFPNTPRTNYDVLIDEQSPRPGQQKFEKMIAGLYLGEIARQVIVDLQSQGHIFKDQDMTKLKKPYSLETATLSDIEEDPNENLIDTLDLIEKRFGIKASFAECTLVRRLAELVGTRSARLSAAGVAAICKKKGYKSCHVGADGSVYAKYPHFRARGQQAFRDIFGPEGDNIQILPAEDGSGVGAALIAATVVQQRKSGPAVDQKNEPNQSQSQPRFQSQFQTQMNSQNQHEGGHVHVRFMKMAMDEARKCIYVPTAFNVGAVIVKDEKILSTGYSRELPGNTHAEQCALSKLMSPEGRLDERVRGSDVYTTMEPCSTRLSGNLPCVDRLVGAKVGRVFQGVEEPADFVDCVGSSTLREAGIQVVTVPGFQEEALAVARGGR